MRTIAQITAELDAAQALVKQLRDERIALILSKSPYQVGAEFTNAGKQWKVDSVAANSKLPEVWLHCRFMTAAKTWSRGTTVHCRKVEG